MRNRSSFVPVALTATRFVTKTLFWTGPPTKVLKYERLKPSNCACGASHHSAGGSLHFRQRFPNTSMRWCASTQVQGGTPSKRPVPMGLDKGHFSRKHKGENGPGWPGPGLAWLATWKISFRRVIYDLQIH